MKNQAVFIHFRDGFIRHEHDVIDIGKGVELARTIKFSYANYMIWTSLLLIPAEDKIHAFCNVYAISNVLRVRSWLYLINKLHFIIFPIENIPLPLHWISRFDWFIN